MRVSPPVYRKMYRKQRFYGPVFLPWQIFSHPLYRKKGAEMANMEMTIMNKDTRSIFANNNICIGLFIKFSVQLRFVVIFCTRTPLPQELLFLQVEELFGIV